MFRFVSVFLFSFVFLATSVAASDIALVIGNRNYKRAGWMYDAERALDTARKLRDSGYTVVSGQDLTIGQTRNALREFVDRLEDADRAIIILNGHFVHSDGDTWFLPVDAARPDRISANYQGLSLQTVLEIIGSKPGASAVFLGTSDRRISTSGGIKAGIGTLNIPQGVFVARGKPGDIALTVSRDFLEPGTGFARALANAPSSVSGHGFVSDVGALLPPESVELPVALDDGSTDEGYWRAINELGMANGMRFYLLAFPQGIHADEARQRLAEDTPVAPPTPEEKAKAAEDELNLSRNERRKIQENLTLLGYETNGIDGIFGRGSRRAITRWQRDRGFNATGYLVRRQINRLSRQAATRAEELAAEARRKQRELENADRSYWQATGAAAGDEGGLHDYLAKYPDGLFADVAVARLDAIAEAKRQSVSNMQREVWDTADRENTIDSYETYLGHFPDGVFADEAKARLTKLREEEAKAAVNEAAKQEEAKLKLNGFARVLVEQQLIALGFDAGQPDGKFNKKTRRAIRRFQRARGFEVTGYLTRQTIVRLIAEAG